MDEKKENMFFKVALAESILAVLIIISVLITRFFFKSSYKAVKNWYLNNMTADIDISEIVKGAENEI